MKKNNLLQYFEYWLIAASSNASMTKAAFAFIEGMLPLMHVVINFEKGKFFLEGDWPFLVDCNRHAVPTWFSVHNGRVGIEADIYPACIIDLDDNNNDGLLCPVKGIIRDGNGKSKCSGFIVLDKTGTRTVFSNHKWDISFYLYDYQVDNFEIKYKLSVYAINGKINST